MTNDPQNPLSPPFDWDKTAQREYRRCLDYLYARINYERLGKASPRHPLRLARMNALLDELGNPHHRLNIVHIAGTKGKGSTATMVAQMAMHSGYRCGLYTSPHLQCLEERFRINGTMASAPEMISLIRRVQAAADAVLRNGEGDATFFELTTAIAFCHFEASGCDLAVFEVGLGGRLDSTNVCQPLVTAITSIGLDHQSILGHSIPQIAREKAGIIKAQVPVVSGVLHPEAIPVIAQIAQELDAPLIQINRDFCVTAVPDDGRACTSQAEENLVDENSGNESLAGESQLCERSSADFQAPIGDIHQHSANQHSANQPPTNEAPASEHPANQHPPGEHSGHRSDDWCARLSVTPISRQSHRKHSSHQKHSSPLARPTLRSHENLRLGLVGEHQLRNAAVALCIADCLSQAGGKSLVLPSDRCASALADIQIAGRIEPIANDPLVILDTAHNPDSIEALCNVLKQRFAPRDTIVVFGTSADKDAGPMLASLSQCANRIVLTRYRTNPRWYPPQQLAQIAAEVAGQNWEVVEDAGAAVEIARQRVGTRGVVVICGSFFLASELRAKLQEPTRF